MNTMNKTAKLAGLFYFVYVLASIVADQFGQFVFADARDTVDHILAQAWQFRLGVVISLFSYVLFFLAAWYLYILLKPVGKNLALLFLLLNLGGFGVIVVSHLNLFGSLMVLSGSDYFKIFQPDQLQSLAVMFIKLYKDGSTMAQIPFGVWLFPLGYLVYKSGFLPKILGIFLIADCFGLFVYVCQRFLFPDYTFIAYPCWALGFIAEVGFTLWLLIKGVNEKNSSVLPA